MRGKIEVKELDGNALRKQMVFVSEKDYDQNLGYFWIVLLPVRLNKKPTFYYRKTDNGYQVEGEGYLITKKSRVGLYKKKVRRGTKEAGRPIQFRELR